MELTAITLKINGVRVKAPKVGGITRKSEKVWSSNTGRAASTKMVGTIRGIKKTLSISWPPLTKAERDLIEAQISNASRPFVPVEIMEPDGSVQTFECYFGTPSFKEWDLVGGQWRCVDGKVDAIER